MGNPPGGGRMMQTTRRTEGKKSITQVMKVILGGKRMGVEDDRISAYFLSVLYEVILLSGFSYHFFVLVIFAHCYV